MRERGGGGRTGAKQDPRTDDEREAMNVRWRKPRLDADRQVAS